MVLKIPVNRQDQTKPNDNASKNTSKRSGGGWSRNG